MECHFLPLMNRERAPLAATEDLLGGSSSQRGPLSVAVPGELMGYWEAKKRHGNPEVSWESLVQPTIGMCLKEGIPVTK